MNKLQRGLLLSCVGLLIFEMENASAVILPYSSRTFDYSSWTPAPRGDINSIGMAGATLAIPTNISAAEANPAGYAMLTDSITALLNRTALVDRRIQKSGDLITSDQIGLAASPDDWGFSLAYYSSMTESGIYVSPNTGDTTKVDVSMKEICLTVAHSFFGDSLALGATLDIGHGIRSLDDSSSSNFGLGYKLGMLYRLPLHIVAGVSYTPSLTVNPAANPDPQTILPGFNRTMTRPSLFGVGLGWIPNRFFKMGASMTYVGSTQNTALFADQTIFTGGNAAWVPRVGASYVVADFVNFRAEATAGTYYEPTRFSNQGGRLHVTGGIEVHPYFVNLGAGFDVSADNPNLVVSLGIDIVRTAQAFSIIPKDPLPPYNGLWPPMDTISADGLPPGLTGNERRKFEVPTVEQVTRMVEEVPQNIAKKVSGLPTTVDLKEAKDKQKQAQKKIKRKTISKKKRSRNPLELPTR